jgi:hypothetical protein
VELSTGSSPRTCRELREEVDDLGLVAADEQENAHEDLGVDDALGAQTSEVELEHPRQPAVTRPDCLIDERTVSVPPLLDRAHRVARLERGRIDRQVLAAARELVEHRGVEQPIDVAV